MQDARRPSSGCAMLALYGGMFRRRRSASMSSLSRYDNPSAAAAAAPARPVAGHPPNSKRGAYDDSSLVPRQKTLSLTPPPAAAADKSLVPAGMRAPPPVGDRNKAKPSKMTPEAKPSSAAEKYTGMAAELDEMIRDHQKVKGTDQLVRATSGNMMLHRNLGNLNARVAAGNAAATTADVSDHLTKAAKERKPGKNGYAYSAMGNIVRVGGGGGGGGEDGKPPELCRALSHRTDPEKLKEMGNEEYRHGRYAEAVALYDQAIIVEPGRPVYWSNKAAALSALGRLVEAVGDCREALRIDPSYCRAHHRLAGLFLRLGEADKAIHHFKQSLREASSSEVSRAQSIKTHIANCSDARKLKNWVTVLKESQAAVSEGADSAPQVLALQAEALLKLQEHDEADSVFNSVPRFGVDELTKLFGTVGHAYVLMIRAQVDMAAGRFEEAVSVAQTASQLDPSNREIAMVLRRAKAVASARSIGNDLFKASRFAEACIAYGEGLDKESSNAVLLCNRAACHARLGRYEKAIEDCDIALAVRPSYTKARLRRADCNVRLERWEASLRDYQVLVQELPGNEGVVKALSEVEAMLNRQRNEGTIRTSQQ